MVLRESGRCVVVLRVFPEVVWGVAECVAMFRGVAVCCESLGGFVWCCGNVYECCKWYCGVVWCCEGFLGCCNVFFCVAVVLD